MADNVQGFNHLDDVLMNLGQQFRNDALQSKMAQFKLGQAKGGGAGGWDHGENFKRAILGATALNGAIENLQGQWAKTHGGTPMPRELAVKQLIASGQVTPEMLSVIKSEWGTQAPIFKSRDIQNLGGVTEFNAQSGDQGSDSSF